MAMGKIRTIKPEFFTSPSTAEASMEARLLFIAMWCWADDYGIGETNLLGLRAFAFPEDDEYLTSDIKDLCREVARCYGVRFYSVGRRKFYQISTWDDHQKTQRRAKDKNPHADDENAQVDTRFHPEQGTSEQLRGTSEQLQGNCIDGNGNGNGNGNSCSTRSVEQVSEPSHQESDFDEFWAACPRKVGKQKARTKFAAAVKRAGNPRPVIDGMKRFAADSNLPEKRFIPHPTTWLERDGWEDEPLPPRHDTQPQRTPGTRMEDWEPPHPTFDVIEGEVIPQWQLHA